MPDTIKKAALKVLRIHGVTAMTAAQISKQINYSQESVSSILKRMVDSGEIKRVKGFGPRGGFGYYA